MNQNAPAPSPHKHPADRDSGHQTLASCGSQVCAAPAPVTAQPPQASVSMAMPMESGLSSREIVLTALREAQAALARLLVNDATLDDIAHAAAVLVRTFEQGGRVYSCGNGGSMSDAMHFAEELTGRYRGNRPGLPAQAISDVGHLTCVANDFGYDQVFSRYVLSHGRPGDCLLAISTSGKSANVVNAAVAARELGMTVVALTGVPASDLGALADVCMVTPGGAFADRTQELHIKVIHILLELVERHFFPANYVDAAGASA